MVGHVDLIVVDRRAWPARQDFTVTFHGRQIAANLSCRLTLYDTEPSP